MKGLSLLALPALVLVPVLGGCRDNAANMSANTASGLNATTAMAPANGTDAMAPATSPTDAPTYLAQAGASDMFEIESSKAVLDKTKDAKVRDFAQMMIKAHQQSTAKLKAAAAEAKLTVAPPKLAPDQQAMLDDIKAATGDAADAAYVKDQRTAHDAALALHTGYASGGDTAALKQAAGEIAQVVQQHIAHLADLTAQ